MFTKYGLPLVAVALLAFAIYHVISGQRPVEASKPVTQPPRNTFANTVAGAGMIEPQTENISIGSPVPGVVVEVYAKVGMRVQSGTPLFRLDDRQLAAEFRLRKSALASSKAELVRLENAPRPESVMIREAEVSAARATVAEQEDQLARTRTLAARKVATQEDLVVREQSYKGAVAQLERAQAQYQLEKAGTWKYDLDVQRAAVDQAAAQVASIQTELDRLIVRSQVPGEVLQVTVRPGEFVGAPASRTLVIMGNLRQLRVRVDIDEYDIHRFRKGAPARATLKGDPSKQFALEFVRVEPYVIPKQSLTGDNTERVDTRVLQVIYNLDAGDEQLYVGQQLDVFVDLEGKAKTADIDQEPPRDGRVESAAKG